MHEQFPLALGFVDLNGFDNFVAGDNQALLTRLDQQLNNEGDSFSYLWSEVQSGKTHLLQSACRAASEGGKRAMYLPLSKITLSEPCDVLQGLGSVEVIAIDDLQAVAGKLDWEQALYALLYEARQHGSIVVMAGNSAPQELNLVIPDLRTRIEWGGSWLVAELADEHCEDFLISDAVSRGLSMNADVAKFILRRHGRTMPALTSLMTDLDRASLAERRALSLAFVKRFVGEQP